MTFFKGRVMHKIILDFDNTMGVAGCDVDDGLALLYALGNPDAAEVLGCTCSYGNSDIETVYANTCDMFDRFGLDIPYFKGCAAPFDPADPRACVSDAAQFLVEQARAFPGEIDLLVTGSASNVKGAAVLDPGFTGRLRSITHMGGITHQLVYAGTVMDELNLSCDPMATCESLSAPVPVFVATAHHCEPAWFKPAEFRSNFCRPDLPGGGAVYERCRYWFDDMERRYHWDGFVCWDVVAAAMLLEPDLFEDEVMDVVPDPGLLAYGLLWRGRPDVRTVRVHTPVIKDPELFVSRVYGAWHRAASLIG